MFKSVADLVVVFDSEYVPCLNTGRRVYRLPAEMPDAEVLAHMYAQAGDATTENPKPMLKLMMYRVISISYLSRRRTDSGVTLKLVTLTGDEAEIIGKFLRCVGEFQPQLVGFASHFFDLRVMFQRALITGANVGMFCVRPAKPWEGPDYFSDFSDDNVDLLSIIGGKGGKANPKLGEIALGCGIPGKMGLSGADVADAWLAGRIEDIAHYNECDVLTTFLLWLRIARMAGFITDQQDMVELNKLLEKRIALGFASHLQEFSDEWLRLQSLTT